MLEILGEGSGVELDLCWSSTTRGRTLVAPTLTGVSIGVVLDGEISIALGRRAPETLRRNQGFILSAMGDNEVSYHVAAGNYRLVVLHVRHEAIDQMRRLESQGSGRVFTKGTGRGASPALIAWPPDPSALAIASQIICCPYVGDVRRLYLEAKRLELLAVIAQQVCGVSSDTALPPSTRQSRLRSARDILIAEFRDPPGLDALAKRVGMSTSLLTQEFRKEFGTSVVEFLQAHRLNYAFERLQEGQSVSQAAYSAGYSPTHFTTLFRRKFGASPRSVVKQSFSRR